MKKYLFTLVAGILIGALAFAGMAFASGLEVAPSTQGVMVDGKPVQIEAYSINGANYFKARDFASALDIGMWYNADTRSVMIETDKGYDVTYTGPQTSAASTTAPAGQTYQTYKEFPTVPDYGTFAGYSPLESGFEGDMFFVTYLSVGYTNGLLAEYEKMLIIEGFAFHPEVTDSSGVLRTYYNGKHIVMVGVNKTIIGILIQPFGASELSALPSSDFPAAIIPPSSSPTTTTSPPATTTPSTSTPRAEHYTVSYGPRGGAICWCGRYMSQH